MYLNTFKLTKTDSLESTVHALKSQVDSLHRIVLKTTIAENFFNQVLASQLGIFMVIVAALGLISWGAIVLPLKHREEAFKTTINSLIEKQIEGVNEFKILQENRFKELVDKQEEIAFHAMRGMYLGSIGREGFDLTAFLWAIRIADDCMTEQTKMDWIDLTIDACIDAIKDDSFDKSTEEIENLIRKMKTYDNIEFQERIKELENTYYRIKFAPTPQPTSDNK